MQLLPPLVLLKLVTAIKGKDEVEPNVMKAYWGSRGVAPLLTTTLHGEPFPTHRVLHPGK
jgi:hypothetical protein